MINNINWNNIRAIHNSLNDGFEELVCQLARRENIKGEFRRIGKPDSGKECYWELDNGELYMWQAKYFTTSLTSSQWTQIKKSIITAIDNHPKLTKYYLCLPLDMPDGKVKDNTSMLDKWKTKTTEWKIYAARKGVNIYFEFWGSSELISKLSKKENEELINFHFNTHEINNIKEKLSSPTLSYRTTNEQVKLYDNIQKQANIESLKNFVHFYCTINDVKTSTEKLSELLLSNSGGIILGKSGCGKSILAKWISYNFNGSILFLEAKYYETNINDFIDKVVRNNGFGSGSMFLKACQESQDELLIVIDGLNECSIQNRISLTLELKEVINQHAVKFLLTTQLFDEVLKNLNAEIITVELPEMDVKKAIAEKYCGSVLKLEALLSVAKTSIEAKLIGEIGTFSIEKISRFDLFEAFVRKKLQNEQTNIIPFLSSIANFLSTNLSFSLSLQKIECLIKDQNLTHKTLQDCITSNLLIQNLNKISFTHEMFLNFFIANNISKSLKNSELIINELNAPKNSGNKLFIIGAIEDPSVLDEVLNSISDDKLLLSLFIGEGGEYCRIWAKNTLTQIIDKIDIEVKNIVFEIIDDKYWQIQLKSDTITNWTNQEWAFINIIPNLLYKEIYLFELFDIIGRMDSSCNEAFRNLLETAKEKKINLRSGIFAAIYANIGEKSWSALSCIFSSLISGWTSFNNINEIKTNTIIEIIKGKKLSNGQFYLLLHLCIYDEKAPLLFPCILSAMSNEWKYIPHILKNKILESVGHCYTSEEQRLTLIETLNTIHSNTQDPFLSTNIFEALSSLNALDEDALAHESTVENQIKNLLSNPDENNHWDEASGLFYYQFDHPYSSAYCNVISRLNPSQSSLFYEMALKANIGCTLFTSSLIFTAVSALGDKVSPHLLKFIETPISDETMPQNSLEVFIIAHIILGQYSYPIKSRYVNEENELSKTLFALAEIYYWLNRSDIDLYYKKENCKSPTKVLFDPCSKFTIESIWQAELSFRNFFYNSKFPKEPIISPNQIFSDEIARSCRLALTNPHHQKSVYGFSREEEITEHAIELLKRHGNISDLKVFRELSKHPSFGKSAIEAIKYIEGH